MTSIAEDCKGSGLEILKEPKQSITFFNISWIQWMTSLQKQMPELHEDFDKVINMLYAGKNEDENCLMYAFQKYTAPYLSMIKERQVDFFDVLCDISKSRGIPPDFKNYFLQLSAKQQDQIWITLDSLTIWVAQVYPDYKRLLEIAKTT